MDAHFKKLLDKKLTRKEFLGIGALAVASLVGLGGILETLRSHAATAAISLEPEQGIASSGAIDVADAAASNAQAIRFAGPAVSGSVPIPTDAYGYLAAPLAPIFTNTFWTKTGVQSAPLHPNSAAIVAELTHDVDSVYGGVAAFNAHSFNTSVVIAPVGTAYQKVAFYDQQNKGTEPATFAAVCAKVPIPAGTVPSTGTDAELTIIDASNGDVFEFWQMKYNRAASKNSGGVVTPAFPNQWSACWGGKTNIYSGSGYFTDGMGASSTGDVIAGGVMGIRETQAAIANGNASLGHTLNMATSTVAPASTFQWPAQRGDGGSTSTSLIAEGQWFRLDPTIDVDALTGLTNIAKVLAKTMQTHGIINTDQSGAVSLIGESPNQIKAAGMVDPWIAFATSSTGTVVPDYSVLANFPWSKLEALMPNWGAPAADQFVYKASGTAINENGNLFATATSAAVATSLVSYLNYVATAPTAYTSQSKSIIDGSGVTVATGAYVVLATRAVVILNANHAADS